MRKMRPESLKIALAPLVLGVGVIVGVLVSQLASSIRDVTAQSTVRGSPLDELQLTTIQRQQMRSIWEDVRSEVQTHDREALEIQRQRDRAVVALLDGPGKQEFVKISGAYADKLASTTDRRNEALQRGIEQSNTILNETQRQKYHALLKARLAAMPGAPAAAAIGDAN